jgi:hypothetical protein
MLCHRDDDAGSTINATEAPIACAGCASSTIVALGSSGLRSSRKRDVRLTRFFGSNAYITLVQKNHQEAFQQSGSDRWR